MDIPAQAAESMPRLSIWMKTAFLNSSVRARLVGGSILLLTLGAFLEDPFSLMIDWYQRSVTIISLICGAIVITTVISIKEFLSDSAGTPPQGTNDLDHSIVYEKDSPPASPIFHAGASGQDVPIPATPILPQSMRAAPPPPTPHHSSGIMGPSPAPVRFGIGIPAASRQFKHFSGEGFYERSQLMDSMRGYGGARREEE